MKRLLPLAFLFVASISVAAFADHIYFIPNSGLGENFAYVAPVNGHQVQLSGGTDFSFFNSQGYAPGSTLGGQTCLFLFDAVVWVNGVPLDFSFPQATLFLSTFTLPTNGKNFRIPVQIGFDASGINYETGQTIELGAAASGHISFYFSNGSYYAGNFVQTPEPATLGFVGVGLAGILASARKRRRMRHDRTCSRRT